MIKKFGNMCITLKLLELHLLTLPHLEYLINACLERKRNRQGTYILTVCNATGGDPQFVSYNVNLPESIVPFCMFTFEPHIYLL